MRRLAVHVRPGEYVIARLAPDAEVDPALFSRPHAGLVSLTRTSEEACLICPAEQVPAAPVAESGLRLITAPGPAPFSLTGIIAALTSALAAAGISLFTLSTFAADHVLVQAGELDRAIAALRAAGHEVIAE